jgi:hypothetical protein
MRRKHTQSKKARRASAFHKTGSFGTPSRIRVLKREDLQRPTPKTFGKQIRRFQRVFFKKNCLGTSVYKTIAHAGN